MPQTAFEEELEVFRTEEETAQQYFFCYLSVRTLAAKNPAVLEAMNRTPLFWITTHHAMLLSAIVALGRIFDQDSKHNINSLMSTTSKSLALFSKSALAARKEAAGLTKQQAAAYVSDKYELTPQDVRALRRKIAEWRRLYESGYREIRHKVFAHKEVSDVDETHDLWAKTSVDELKALFAFLNALYTALWELFYNGRQPLLTVRTFVLPPDSAVNGREMSPGEKVYGECQAVLTSMLSNPVAHSD
jgi:AbiU2